ncbi:hypothetical protein AGABI1DRAFT_83786 [Agaricus bisporus var. burnettii JB137-S8]|uniref:Chitin-binding type-3 domain-containing protein n=1 Tax=Agaricus bisporus var. burnettii (strain JB137-S8 / ATCC MYA-4627 / FGSC 10392) TaxID=597362 RepID=K5W203_AGABU|nr:uncharacterized protein AGABI1DRAFT_83786 [Agaricus bisporus var. burnettii JB137-S8]EKM80829.1 hypothetical protein AGABI1DRAFT_83786 [Agaricus bisporus var. burnettii JB137-S8]
MTRSWEPGTQYNLGDVVEYNGDEYRIIQAHFSQSDWAPDRTPALWGKLPHRHHQQGQYQQQQECQPQQPQKTCYDYGKQEQAPQHSDSKEKKNWFGNITESQKQALEVGGGVALGAGLLGGAFAAWKHHQHKEEAHDSFEAWANAARGRAEEFRAKGPQGPATWVYNEGKHIPEHAILVGTEHNWNLYICRAYCDGGVQIGKASDVFKKGAVIGYKEDEHHLDQYEILLGDMRGLKWVQTGNSLDLASLGATPVEGGYENDHTRLYIARAFHKGAKHPGKVSERLDGAYIPYDGKEKCVKEYEVLCYL